MLAIPLAAEGRVACLALGELLERAEVAGLALGVLLERAEVAGPALGELFERAEDVRADDDDFAAGIVAPRR
jgi:hypothetical protein